MKNVNAIHVIAKMKSNDHDKSLFGGGGNALENRKLLNFWARFAISIANALTFLVLLKAPVDVLKEIGIKGKMEVRYLEDSQQSQRDRR